MHYGGRPHIWVPNGPDSPTQATPLLASIRRLGGRNEVGRITGDFDGRVIDHAVLCAHRAARCGNVAVVQAANGGQTGRGGLNNGGTGHARADDLGGGFALFGQRFIKTRNLRRVVFGDGLKAGVDDHVDVMRVGCAQPVWAV